MSVQYFRKKLAWDCENNLCFDVNFLLLCKYKGKAKKGTNRLYYKCVMEQEISSGKSELWLLKGHTQYHRGMIK